MASTIVNESEIRHILNFDYNCKSSFRNRNGKIYLTVTGNFTHSESLKIRERIERLVGNKIYMTSGGFSCLPLVKGQPSVPTYDGRMVLRLNPDDRMLEALNY